MAAEHGLARSAEEEKILRDIREEKEKLWIEIQVWTPLENLYKSTFVKITLLQELRRQIIDIDNELAALDEANDE